MRIPEPRIASRLSCNVPPTREAGQHALRRLLVIGALHNDRTTTPTNGREDHVADRDAARVARLADAHNDLRGGRLRERGSRGENHRKELANDGRPLGYDEGVGY